MNAPPVKSPILCDSCGQPASPEHIRERLARLQLATRFRPVHISLLLVCTAPPANLADDLYAWDQQSAGREARTYIEGLFNLVAPSPTNNSALQLAEFQRRGVYLASLVECPLPAGPPDSRNVADSQDLAARYGPVLVKRIAHSYKPRQIALLSPMAPGLAHLLRTAGFGPRLIADGQGIEVPSPDDAVGIARIRALLTLTDSAPA